MGEGPVAGGTRELGVGAYLASLFGPFREGEVGAVVGLGSNLGDRLGFLEAAVRGMARAGLRVLALSGVYETDPVGPPQPRYLNAVGILATLLGPRELLLVLQGLERMAGRVREVRWGPRTLDLDLLLYGDERVSLPELEIPHPRLEERAFVLAPLAEVAPGLPLPSGRTARGALAALAEAKAGRLGVRPFSAFPSKRRGGLEAEGLGAIFPESP